MTKQSTFGLRKRVAVILLVFLGLALINAELMGTALAFETRHTFTGQEKDPESGLMYYGARYYNPMIGRFTQQDPAIMNPSQKMLANPQLLNPYSYAANNPMKYIDPSGEKLMISDAYGIEFVNKAMEDLQSIYGGINMKESGEVKLNKGSRVGSWFTKDSKSLQLMKRVIDNKHTTTIVSGRENTAGQDEPNMTDQEIFSNSTNGTGINVNVEFNPKGYNVTIPTLQSDGTVADLTRPPYIGLSHELIHASHYMDGKRTFDAVNSYKGLNGAKINGFVQKEELRTVGGLGFDKKNDITENQIRKEHKLPLRNQYQTIRR